MEIQKETFDNCEKTFGPLGRNVLERVSKLSPRTVNLVNDYFANNLYSDLSLDKKTRELIVISIIAAQGGLNDGPLKVHIKSALNMGITVDEIVATLETVGAYAGMPKCISAMLRLEELCNN